MARSSHSCCYKGRSWPAVHLVRHQLGSLPQAPTSLGPCAGRDPAPQDPRDQPANFWVRGEGREVEQQGLHGECLKAHMIDTFDTQIYADDGAAGLQIGFFALLIVELFAKRGLLEMLGFKVGQGLPFEI